MALTVTAVCIPPAQAYLDPGTGSMILQGIIGAIAGALVVLRIYWTKIKNFLSPNNPSNTADKDDREKD
ncbi:MAG: hypothetical protein HOM58_18940 [Rhodospirillaceae bacterium]|nr:hypothetical protein [Rhodospirillaceae bacterium]MBT5050586.1 hypothetical protein [Rhodospirillaceae bacterium]MBT5457184.1 hypothetical protein [Rhodospirillaceae bacterium]